MKAKKSAIDYPALLQILTGTIDLLEGYRPIIESIREPRYKKSLAALKNCVGSLHFSVSVIGKNVPKNILHTLTVSEEVCRESATEFRKLDAGIFKDSAKVVEYCAKAIKKVINKLAKQ